MVVNRIGEFDVMTMAGHVSFETKRWFCLVCSDLLGRVRKASSVALKFVWTKPLRGR